MTVGIERISGGDIAILPVLVINLKTKCIKFCLFKWMAYLDWFPDIKDWSDKFK